ncbi:MAG: ABC transporter substrate-binding protein [Thermoflexaceae bacterium]|nr:ABC transporter substrate-binding protein [Thermoflexaceae bacterium]
MQSKKWLLGLVAALVILPFAAVACGDDDDDDAGGETPQATATTGGGSGSPTTAATKSAAEVLAGIKGDSTGVTDTEVKIGSHYAKTGPAAVYWDVAAAWLAYFDEVNKKGGIHGRKVKFLVEDDGYNPTNTVTVVKKLVEQDQVFMLFGGLGTPTSEAIAEYVKAQGIPSYFVMSGSPKWATFGPSFSSMNPDYIVEGRALGTFIAKDFKGKKVGILYQNDDFGKTGRDGLKQALGSAVTIVGEETYEANAADITSQALKLLSSGAEVLAVYATPAQLAGALKNVKAQGKTVTWVASGVTASSSTAKLAEGAMDGVFSVGLFPDVSEAATNPGMKKVTDFLKANGMANPNYFHIVGYAMAEHLEQLLLSTGKNLNRSSIVYAFENIAFQGSWKCTLCYFPSITSKDDHRPIEALFVQKWDEAQKKFIRIGETMNLETTKK